MYHDILAYMARNGLFTSSSFPGDFWISWDKANLFFSNVTPKPDIQ